MGLRGILLCHVRSCPLAHRDGPALCGGTAIPDSIDYDGPIVVFQAGKQKIDEYLKTYNQIEYESEN